MPEYKSRINIKIEKICDWDKLLDIKIKEEWKTAQDIIEARKMNFAQGNIFKVAITFNVGRHQGTDYLRELNKMEYFIKREKKRIAQEGV